jgi:hypothetical protein
VRRGQRRREFTGSGADGRTLGHDLLWVSERAGFVSGRVNKQRQRLTHRRSRRAWPATAEVILRASAERQQKGTPRATTHLVALLEGQRTLVGEAQAAVDSDPKHDLRVKEVLQVKSIRRVRTQETVSDLPEPPEDGPSAGCGPPRSRGRAGSSWRRRSRPLRRWVAERESANRTHKRAKHPTGGAGSRSTVAYGLTDFPA